MQATKITTKIKNSGSRTVARLDWENALAFYGDGELCGWIIGATPADEAAATTAWVDRAELTYTGPVAP